jgi:RimJ/RimL family protein N-acetyltransferase
VVGIRFDFRPFTADHLPLLQRWLKEPHVAEYWQEPQDEAELRDKYLNILAARDVRPYVVYIDGVPIGYIQDYQASLVGGGWWPNAKPGTFGIDQFIGDPEWVGKGFGTMLIREFVGRLLADPGVEDIIVDPDPNNLRAIHVYEMIGFKRLGLTRTPGGDALVLRLRRTDLRGASLMSQEARTFPTVPATNGTRGGPIAARPLLPLDRGPSSVRPSQS